MEAMAKSILSRYDGRRHIRALAVYTLSEREGALRVSIEGQLVAMPGGANMLWLSSVR